MLSIIFTFLLLAGSSLCDSQNFSDSSTILEESESGYFYQEEFFEVPLDHFSFARRETFKIRYLLNSSFWDKENNGPIFFYTGNEGSIDGFAENTGFMWELAEEFGAAVIFAEHRFYGASSPPDSLKHKLEAYNIKAMGYLTVSQALADYAQLISWFKAENKAEGSPVIAFGGSYGGLLTAWLRMKYPHLVAGGIASSAPFYLQDVPCGTYDAALASIFGQDGNGNCVNVIRKSWRYLNHLGKTNKGRKWLSKAWKLCTPLSGADDVYSMKIWLESMYGFLGMANYPYPANFLQDLPAYPVKTFCSHLKGTDASSEKHVILDMFQAINTYINNSGSVDCFDYTAQSMFTSAYSSSDDDAFNYQSCTELIDPECDDGIHDFFEPVVWNFKEFSDQCFDTYGVRPQENKTALEFGGRDIIAASNIVFSNGLLDPWFSYGVLANLSDTLVAIIIPDAAHHLDLRASDEADPPSVVEAREKEKGWIKRWISQYQEERIKVANSFANFNF